jgi:hypothetical protein
MSRAAALRRIAKLYGVVEDTHALALQQATAHVLETERAIHAERIAIASAASAGRTALHIGEREDWLLAHAHGELSTVRAGVFEGLKAQRVEAESAARSEFLASRLKTEQMKQLVTRMTEQAALEEGRRTQAVSDDRYAARRTWLANRHTR